jgi:hypothetical protein
VNAREVRIWGAVAAGAVLGVGAVAVAATEPVHSAAGSTMQTGVTQTATTPPTAPAVGRAAPFVTGPAQLPGEEQGLPG